MTLEREDLTGAIDSRETSEGQHLPTFIYYNSLHYMHSKLLNEVHVLKMLQFLILFSRSHSCYCCWLSYTSTYIHIPLP